MQHSRTRTTPKDIATTESTVHTEENFYYPQVFTALQSRNQREIKKKVARNPQISRVHADLEREKEDFLGTRMSRLRMNRSFPYHFREGANQFQTDELLYGGQMPVNADAGG